MERNQDSEEGERNITINGDANHHHHHHHHHHNDDEGLCELKREIASHSMYSLLLHSHFNCFKLCLGDIEGEMMNPTAVAPNQNANLFTADHQSDLDQFMEAYCVTLNKLKEAMEEPQQESMAFINLMYSQLDDLLQETEKVEGEMKK